jgi:hypothetical protein
MHRRTLMAAVTLLVLVQTVQAHFVWLLPGERPNTVKLVFSDKLAADVDNPDLISRIKQTSLFVHDPNAKHIELKLEPATAAFVSSIPEKTHVVRGHCLYGVFQRGDQPPSLLNYYCILKQGELLTSGCFHCQPFQAREESPGIFLVEFEDDPLPGAEVVLIGPKGFGELKGTTDQKGKVAFDLSKAPQGLYGLRAKHVVKQEGEHEGKKYAQVTNYVTLVFRR